MESTLISQTEILRFAVILFRISGIMVFAPFFGGNSIPTQIKIVFSLMATLAMSPAVALAPFPLEWGLSQLVSIILSEALIGIALGLTASFLFAGIQLAGQVIAFQVGFSIVNVIDPQSQVETSVLSIFQNFLGLVFFLMINGHHWFFLAVSDSFRFLPVNGAMLHGPLVQDMIRLSSKMIVAGLQIAGPVVAVTVLSDIILGIIGRTAPQINVLIVGMPLKTLVGLGSLSFTLYFMPQFLSKQFLQLFHDLFALIQRFS